MSFVILSAINKDQNIFGGLRIRNTRNCQQWNFKGWGQRWPAIQRGLECAQGEDRMERIELRWAENKLDRNILQRREVFGAMERRWEGGGGGEKHLSQIDQQVYGVMSIVIINNDIKAGGKWAGYANCLECSIQGLPRGFHTMSQTKSFISTLQVSSLPSLPSLPPIRPTLQYNSLLLIYKLMGLKKDFILSGAYFLILSTVLQSEDAFVYYRDSEPQKDSLKYSRGKMMIAFAIASLINYGTLVLAPYFNCTIQKLSMAACAILLIKYGSELVVEIKFLAIFFELGALYADIIGTGLFYLSSIRVVQILIDRHGLRERAALCFGGAVGVYVLSILLGYALGYMFFEETPVWMFLIALTTMTMVAAGIAYFTFVFTKAPEQERNENNNNQPAVRDDVANAAEGAGDGERFQLFRDGVTFNTIFKFTLTTYGKIIPLIGVQTMLGTLIAYGYSLLEFLIWTSQTESEENKLQHNKDTMIIYSLGGIFTSCLIGFICDRLPVRTLGYGLLVYNGLSLAFLYFAIYIKYFYTTLILFMFLGMTQFAVLVWLLAACSRLYKGIFQVLAANSQLIALAASAYGLGVIFFQNRISPQTKLSLQLAGLIFMNVISFFFMKKLPTETVTIEYLVEELQENADPAARQEREGHEIERREAPVQIEMANQKETMQNKIVREQTIDPQNLL